MTDEPSQNDLSGRPLENFIELTRRAINGLPLPEHLRGQLQPPDLQEYHVTAASWLNPVYNRLLTVKATKHSISKEDINLLVQTFYPPEQGRDIIAHGGHADWWHHEKLPASTVAAKVAELQQPAIAFFNACFDAAPGYEKPRVGDPDKIREEGRERREDRRAMDELFGPRRSIWDRS